MKKVDMSEANQALSELKDVTTGTMSSIPFTLLQRREQKTTMLIANSDSNTKVKGANRWYDYVFTEPVFLSEIR